MKENHKKIAKELYRYQDKKVAKHFLSNFYSEKEINNFFKRYKSKK